MTQALTGIGGLQAAAPTAATTPAKETAEGFERLLLGQLTKALVDSALPADGASAAAVGAYREMLPDALTEALMSGGGIGLAKQLEEGMAK
jgi:Rod binding domain-containing protein